MEKLNELLDSLFTWGVEIGKSIIIAALIYIIGRYLVKLINKLFLKVMNKRNLDPAIKSFLGSMVNILLTILLLIAVISALGIETTSFAALIASTGVAIGMALSGNLNNFAGGVMILLFRPYKIGDFIETTGQSGTVKEIQIFHTILTTGDNKTVFVPNGSISSGVLVNYSHQDMRRIEWTVGIEYGEDYERAKTEIAKILEADSRVLKTPAYTIALGQLADSSVNITVRAWVKSSDFGDVTVDFNKVLYATFNEKCISFPYPQIVVHQAKD